MKSARTNLNRSATRGPFVHRVALLAVFLACAGGCSKFVAQGKNAEGVGLYQQSQYQSALQSFQQAAYADPGNADAYYNLAATYHRLGTAHNNQPALDQAENYYNQCLDHSPNHRDCYRGLAVLLVQQDRSEEAFRLLEGWCDREPSHADPKVELARLFEEFGDRAAAKEHLLEAIQNDPNNPRALAALGKIREEMGDRVQALANYQRSLWYDRFQPEVASRAATLQASLGPNAPPAPVGQDTRTVIRRSPLRR